MTSKTPPWKRPAPKRKRSQSLSTSEKRTARDRARRAGRTYPNLIDNMAVATKKSSAKKKRTKKRVAKRKRAAKKQPAKMP